MIARFMSFYKPGVTAKRQLHVGKTVTLVFHAKVELQRPPSGAGRHGDVAVWPPPLQGRSGLFLKVGSGCVAPTAAVRGRAASPMPAGLALAWLRLVLHRLVVL